MDVSQQDVCRRLKSKLRDVFGYVRVGTVSWSRRKGPISFMSGMIRDSDIKEHDEGLMKLVSGTSCIRHTILRDILQSDETIEVNDLCCSVCNGCIRPSLFVPEVTFPPPASVPPAPTRTKRVLAVQKNH